mgnify:CR=1 FL=1|jgi:hypothetical protein
MASAVQLDSASDLTSVSNLVRGSLILGAIQSVLVFATSLSNRGLEGTPDALLTAIFVAVGIAATAFLPAIWLKPRTIEGIAGAAGIGLGAALTYMVIDVAILQPIGTYTNRWWEVGGHSNWWYHPVWWQVSSFISWFGAWIVANQARRNGASIPMAIVILAVCTVVIGALAAVVGFPGASFNVPTFAVAALPGLVLATLVTGLGGARN